VYHAYAGVAFLFLIPALSLAGMPPFSGFIAKLALVRAGLEHQQPLIVATALGVSLLTLFSMAIIWAEVFWKPLPRPVHHPLGAQMEKQIFLPQGMGLLLVPTAGLALSTVAIGLGAEALFPLATKAAEQLLAPAEYIQAVLGKAP
jgi:multicomponent Na+:H+ antiporter subunit D